MAQEGRGKQRLYSRQHFFCQTLYWTASKGISMEGNVSYASSYITLMDIILIWSTRWNFYLYYVSRRRIIVISTILHLIIIWLNAKEDENPWKNIQSETEKTVCSLSRCCRVRSRKLTNIAHLGMFHFIYYHLSSCEKETMKSIMYF